MNLKKGAQVKIISGKDKGKTGEILEINRRLEKVKIKAINMMKRHTKPTKENKGGIISKESFIHQSNVKNIDVKKKEKKITGRK
tara:strand:+ start:1382 stop:1633 length:252 start_codon:yes stop_codon:yes gene_type:complete